MDHVTLGNRPATMPPRTKIEDYQDGATYVRVSLKLLAPSTDSLTLDAQAFQVDATGAIVAGPDGRPSRTPGTQHSVITSSLGDTHTLAPGWVRVVGDYTAESFEPDAPRGSGRPTAPPAVGDTTGMYFDTATGIGYRYDADGETGRIARGKVDEMLRILANSDALAGLDF